MSLHTAPSVSYPLGRSYFLGCLLLSFWLAGLLLVLWWCQLTQPSGWRWWSGFSAVLVAGLAAGAGWKSAPVGQLAWDGEVWRWESVGGESGVAEHELTVIADFQTCLLLRLQNQSRAGLWLWVERRVLPARWMALRRAIYSPRRSSAASRWQDLQSAQPHPLAPSTSSTVVGVSTALKSVDRRQAKP